MPMGLGRRDGWRSWATSAGARVAATVAAIAIMMNAWLSFFIGVLSFLLGFSKVRGRPGVCAAVA